jgi:prevent-host-death family protein
LSAVPVRHPGEHVFVQQHPTNHKGAVAEAMIAAHAIKLGIDVLKPVAEHGRYDLLFNFPDRAVRVQCKWAPLQNETVLIRVYSSRRGPDGLRRTTYTADEIDAVAGYCPQLDRCYLIPIVDIAGRQAVHLRVAPPKNNQLGAVNMADAYELGAVAQLGRAPAWHAGGHGFESRQLHSPEAPSEQEVGAHEFREKFGYWMERAAAGDEILITRRGRRYARLGPPDPQLATGPDSQSKQRTGA